MEMSWVFNVTEQIAVLSDDGKGTTLELNRVSFGNRPPKLDLRLWSEGRPLKGVRMTDEEARALREALESLE